MHSYFACLNRVEVPHGVYPIAPVTAATLVQALFPGSPVCSLAASAVFHVPVWKHVRFACFCILLFIQDSCISPGTLIEC